MIPHMLWQCDAIAENSNSMYQMKNSPTVHDIQIRGLQYRFHCWGDPKGVPVYLLHGCADVGMSFQFLADYMDDNWYLIAPDWRGFGDSDWNSDGYWFPDYLGDLQDIIMHFSPNKCVRLVGHSMGGNIAWLYAGIRPDQVSHAVSLDVYGLPDADSDDAPEQYMRWLDQLDSGVSFSKYLNINGVVERIKKLAPRLSEAQAEFLAGYWAKGDEDGHFKIKHDPRHKRVNPVLYRRAEVISCWKKISADTLLVMAEQSPIYKSYMKDGYKSEIQVAIPQLLEEVISDAGHMLHLEQPASLAGILNHFLKS